MPQIICLATGGTGGHIFPALALADALRSELAIKPLFCGGGLGSNSYFQGNDYHWKEVACGSLSLSRPIKTMLGGQRTLRGVVQSLRILKQAQPAMVVGFGSYYSLPPLVAARMLRIPILLYDGNAMPGRVTRLLSRLAERTAIVFPEAQTYLRGETFCVQPLVRSSTVKDRTPVQEARTHFGLNPELTTLLVFGGSQGAYALNETMLRAAPLLVAETRTPFQVLHFTGSDAYTEQLSRVYAELGMPCHVAAFEQRIGLAWSAADAALCRAGAGTVAEALHFAVPSVLVPYPYATDDHQTANARALESDVEGAICLPQTDLSTARLSECLSALIDDQDGWRSTMQENLLRSQASPQLDSLTEWMVQTMDQSRCLR